MSSSKKKDKDTTASSSSSSKKKSADDDSVDKEKKKSTTTDMTLVGGLIFCAIAVFVWAGVVIYALTRKPKIPPVVVVDDKKKSWIPQIRSAVVAKMRPARLSTAQRTRLRRRGF